VCVCVCLCGCVCARARARGAAGRADAGGQAEARGQELAAAQKRLALVLEMLGAREEEVEDLRETMREQKDVFAAQLETLLAPRSPDRPAAAPPL
jgi:hypothetical protein